MKVFSFQHGTGKNTFKPPNPDTTIQYSVFGQTKASGCVPLEVNLCAVEGSIPHCPSCESVSDLAEVVAGHRFLQHGVPIHLEHIIAAVCHQRSVRERHALIAKGDYCVSPF